jgi:hypothetical protein
MTDLANLVQRLRAIGLATTDEAATALEHLLLERDAVRRITVEEIARIVERSAGQDPDDVAERIRALPPTLSLPALVERGKKAAFDQMHREVIGCGDGKPCKLINGCGCAENLARAVLGEIMGMKEEKR